eukprot:COSAG06_NODE_17122_length_960_cov_0.747967_1_plen_169_part_00
MHAFLAVNNTLQLPATVTTSCEDLMDAMNNMHEAIEPGETVLQMPTNIVEVESRIDYLIGYVKNKNRRRGALTPSQSFFLLDLTASNVACAGMGFALMNNRISYSLVIALLLKVATCMPIFFTLMVSPTKVEDEQDTMAAREMTLEREEESLLGNTSFTCPCSACPVC